MKKSLTALVTASVIMYSGISSVAQPKVMNQIIMNSTFLNGSSAAIDYQITIGVTDTGNYEFIPNDNTPSDLSTILNDYLQGDNSYNQEEKLRVIQELFSNQVLTMDVLKLVLSKLSMDGNYTQFMNVNQAYQQAQEAFGKPKKIQSPTVPNQFKKSTHDGYVVIDTLEKRRTYFNTSDLATLITDFDGKTLFKANEEMELVPVGFFKTDKNLIMAKTSEKIKYKQQLKDSYPKPEGCGGKANPALLVLPLSLISKRKLYKR